MGWLSLATIVLVCVGCASLTPAEEESLAEVQAFTDVTARAYKLSPVQVAVSDSPVAWPGHGLIRVTRETLTAPLPIRDVAIAILLGFQVVQPPKPMSEPHEVEINRRVYPQSNEVAVDILASVKGLPQGIAVKGVYAYLAGVAQGVAEKRLSPAPRIPHPCEQIRAFILRFPEYRLDNPRWCP